MIRGFRPPATDDGGIFTYGPPTEVRAPAGCVLRILRQGRLSIFFRIEFRCSRDFIGCSRDFNFIHDQYPFLSFLKKLNLFSSISYISPLRDSQLRYGRVEIPTLNESRAARNCSRRDTDVK